MPAGIAAITPRYRVKRGLPLSSIRSIARAARTMASATFPISEGWRLNGPRSIQRFEPFTAVPTT
jgi:hypothetical protein